MNDHMIISSSGSELVACLLSLVMLSDGEGQDSAVATHWIKALLTFKQDKGKEDIAVPGNGWGSREKVMSGSKYST